MTLCQASIVETIVPPCVNPGDVHVSSALPAPDAPIDFGPDEFCLRCRSADAVIEVGPLPRGGRQSGDESGFRHPFERVWRQECRQSVRRKSVTVVQPKDPSVPADDLRWRATGEPVVDLLE